jgi:hypothetical protein
MNMVICGYFPRYFYNIGKFWVGNCFTTAAYDTYIIYCLHFDNANKNALLEKTISNE